MSASSPYKSSAESLVHVQNPEAVQFNLEAAESLRKMYMGKREVAGLLSEITRQLQHEADELAGAKDHPDKNVLQKHKAGLRFAHAIAEVLANPSPTITSTNLLEKPQLFGLTYPDTEMIKAWVDKRMQVQNAIEEKYRVLRVDVFRRTLFERYLRNQERDHVAGAYLELDLVGLKTFNTYGPASGDLAITKVARFCKEFLQQKFDIEQPELSVGRKGDEFYLFIPGMKAEQVAEAFKAFYEEQKSRLFVEVNDKEGGVQEKPVIFYWRIGDVSRGNFDAMAEKVEDEIEHAKADAILATVREIQSAIPDHAQQFIALLQYILTKRIPIEVVENLIVAGSSTFAEYFARGENPNEKTQELIQLMSSQEIQELLQQALTRVSSHEENNVTGKVVTLPQLIQG